MHEHGVRTHHDASEGYDHTEPEAPPIWAFTVGSVILLVVVIFAIQQYFEKIWNDAVYDKVLAAPSQELQDLRNRDDFALTHYSYQDKGKGVVRIPPRPGAGIVPAGIRSGQDVLSGETNFTEDRRAGSGGRKEGCRWQPRRRLRLKSNESEK